VIVELKKPGRELKSSMTHLGQTPRLRLLPRVDKPLIVPWQDLQRLPQVLQWFAIASKWNQRIAQGDIR
jgi:hypothetical protein